VWEVLYEGEHPIKNSELHYSDLPRELSDIPTAYRKLEACIRKEIEGYDHLSVAVRPMIPQAMQQSRADCALIRAVADGSDSCVVFTLDPGYVGRTTGEVKMGDIVCILAGQDRPFVLRSNGAFEGEERFRLVDVAWVHDAMHGQAVNEENLKRKRRFRLI
jgi:hypothetical protein